MKSLYKKYLEEDHNFDKSTLLGIICLIIIISGVFGFLYEFVFYYFNSGMTEFYWRGSNFLPWINIYAIGAVFIFFLLFIIPLLIYLIYKKEITIKQSIISLLIVFIITLPLILFVIINTFNFPQINLPFMTIPRLSANRYEQVTSIFSGNFLENSITNFINAIKVLLLQYDELDWNALYGFGTTYVFSTFFCIF